MHELIAAVFLTAMLGTAAPASSQASIEAVSAAQTAEFAGRKPSVYWMVSQGNEIETVSVYFEPFRLPSAWDGSTAPLWVARRAAWPQGAEGVVNWTDSRSCPALEGVLWTLNNLPPPELEIRGLERPTPSAGVPPTLMSSGPTEVTVGGGARQFSRHPGSIQWTAVAGSAGAWGEAAKAALRECWRDHPPRR